MIFRGLPVIGIGHRQIIALFTRTQPHDIVPKDFQLNVKYRHAGYLKIAG
jgi:hypothetical protein